MAYTLTAGATVVRDADGAVIPNDPRNGDWQAYQAWLAAGNVPTPYQAPPATTFDVDHTRNARLVAGFADTAAGNTGKTWQCDADSLANWTAIAASAQPWALGIAPAGSTAPTYAPWGTDNVPIPLTAAQAYGLFAQRVMPWVTATFDYARQMKANIKAGNPPADVNAGWP